MAAEVHSELVSSALDACAVRPYADGDCRVDVEIVDGFLRLAHTAIVPAQ
jgi:hypothetical protein